MPERLNFFGARRIPFLFIIDFDLNNYFVQPLESLEQNIFFDLEGIKNFNPLNKKISKQDFYFSKSPISYQEYLNRFNKVIEQIKLGNTYLLNLTFPTPIKTNLSLLDIFFLSEAKFKLYYKDQFITFSPERFIEITNNTIKTYPMKGTIKASLPKAEETILKSEKEKAEHTMIVDLMRNDLSIIARNVSLNRFRYLEKIKAGEKELWQVSSEITGQLEKNWPSKIGDLLKSILPAGSISGTPKKKTVELIKEIENYQRGFYTGIFGIFDGLNLNSAVMIRFLEKQKNNLFYKSGGGIVFESDSFMEYQEMLDKVYLPL